MATMIDVAKKAGVSVATVSRLINNEEIVSPETARRIYAAIDELSYEPNLLARNLRRNETRVILILSPNVTNPYYSRILDGIGKEAAQAGYSTLIFTTEDDFRKETEALEMLKKRRADGAILMASDIGCDWLLNYSSTSPIVQCCEYDPAVDIPHVSIDNYKATYEAVEYLINLGHKKIAIISSENAYFSTRLRLQAYKDALCAHNLPCNDDLIIQASRDYSFKSGKDRAKDLLREEPIPTAIFCISDTLALGAITAAKEMGFRVPEDITVVGFDDVEFTTMFHPNITTVAQPCFDLGRTAFQMLHDQMAQTHRFSRNVILEHQLVIRESSATAKILD
ncbi:MAG TPA: LacI family DNA-binding transcriptional regulator [Anaerolineales bacterium]|nr:LacI family DNA-binding transcriptional regulator [Anaerolineales bacterium]